MNTSILFCVALHDAENSMINMNLQLITFILESSIFFIRAVRLHTIFTYVLILQ